MLLLRWSNVIDDSHKLYIFHETKVGRFEKKGIMQLLELS